MTALKPFIVCTLIAFSDKLFHNFTQRFVKKLYFNEPLRFSEFLIRASIQLAYIADTGVNKKNLCNKV
ncbi:hypothetical protein BpHYR1_020168 [Brachionus plicatilis]|uniref:Uncharacterized protein n=1 Tax=Brachionus plicatilis TaxID=10195 RepID=A0A3M7RXC7_BRAPC|nr:hypothetical protein BpHYR1_020168 [Brachionus plicatilis]